MILLIVGCAVAALGALLAVLGLAVACMQDKGKRCKFRRPSAAVTLALDLWSWLDTAQAPAPRVPSAPFGATAQPAEDNPPATWDEIRDGWPEPSDEWAQTAALAGEHPYPPLPVTLPRPDGDVHIDPNGHVTVRRREPVAHPTLYDLPVVQGRPYALAMGPDGQCEEVR